MSKVGPDNFLSSCRNRLMWIVDVNLAASHRPGSYFTGLGE